LVTAFSSGSATITATSGNTSATAVVTVVAARRTARRIALLGDGVVLAAIVGALLLLHPFRPPSPAGGAADSLTQARTDTVPREAVVPSPTPSPVDTSGPRQPVDSHPSRPRGGGSPPAAPRDSSESSVATALASAQSARDQAIAAGARDPDLTAGDAEVQQASNLRRQGRRAAAFEHLRRAVALFATAESTAVAAKVAAQRRAPPDTTTKPAPPPTQPSPQPVADPTPQIRGAIAAYAQALENRDLTALQQVFPAMSGAQVRTWQDFFKIARDIKANLGATQIVVSGDRADLAVNGDLTYRNTDSRRIERLPSSFRAQLARAGTGWVITAIQ
jgi:hypothetical protein